MSASRRQIKDMADRLISTMSTSMPSEKADAIVADVATELYRDVLDVDGRIEAKVKGYAHGSFGKDANGKRIRGMALADYEFVATRDGLK